MPETSRERVTRKYRRNLHMHFVRIANFLVVYFTSVFLNVRSSNVLIHATFSVIKETKIFSKRYGLDCQNFRIIFAPHERISFFTKLHSPS